MLLPLLLVLVLAGLASARRNAVEIVGHSGVSGQMMFLGAEGKV